MLITYKNLKDVTFPVFLLGSSNWDLRDGLLFLDGVLLDDQNMPGKTLGQRRLQSPFKSLYPLKKGIMQPVGILKQAGNKAYIDSIGKLFVYEKTIMAVLKFQKIRRVEKRETYSLLWVSNVSYPFEIPRPPDSENKWVGILYIKGFPWLLYQYSRERLKDTRRKI